MILLSFLSCLHRPPSVNPAVPWRREAVHREEVIGDDAWCGWDAEQIVTAEGVLWSVTPPDLVDGAHSDQWCEAGGERSRTLDVVSQRGPYLSTILNDQRCCPEQASHLCVTWDLRTRAPAALLDVEPRRAADLWARLQARIFLEPRLTDWRFSPDEFLLDNGGVRFCGRRDGAIHEVEVQ